MFDKLYTQQQILKDVSKNWWKSKQYDYRFGKYHDILKEKDYVFVLYKTYAAVLIPDENFYLSVEKLVKAYNMVTVDCVPSLFKDYEKNNLKMEKYIPTGVVVKKSVYNIKKPQNLIEFKGEDNGIKKYVSEELFKALINKIDDNMIFYSEPKEFAPLYLLDKWTENGFEGIFMPVRIDE